MATARQIAANQANAARSTGPRTDEGKARSRRNALTHGLTGAGVVLTHADEDAVTRRLADWGQAYPADTPARAWLLRRLVVMSVRLDACAAHQDALRAYQARRADSDGWDLDRRAEAEALAFDLSRRPARTAAALVRSRHGCDWLISRWRSLADVVASGTPWDDAQRGLALDLLGTPRELRRLDQLLDPAEQASLADRELQRLDRIRTDSLDQLDEIERSLVASGHHVCPDREVLRLQRHEAACLRAYYRTLAELLASSPGTNAPGPPHDDPPPSEPPAAEQAVSTIETPMPMHREGPLEDHHVSQTTSDTDTPAPTAPLAASMSLVVSGTVAGALPSRPLNRRARRAALKLAAARR